VSVKVASPITGNIWKLEIEDGAQVAAGDAILIMESMKMEIPVEAPAAGACRFRVAPGDNVQEDDVLAVIE
jgi:biotin carboxyl carrier protein